MRIRRMSFPAALLFFFCLLSLLGGLTGNWIGEKLRQQRAFAEMNSRSQSIKAHVERILASAHKTIDAANASEYETCSPDHLAYMRELVFSAFHIKDIGQLRDERLLCSTLLTNKMDLLPRSQEDVRLRDGTYVYGDKALITPRSRGPILGRGNANVVLSSTALDAFHAPHFASFSVVLTNEDQTQFARLYSFPQTYLAQDNLELIFAGQGRNAALLASSSPQITTCDNETGVCVNLALNPQWRNSANRLFAFLFTGLGVLLGAAGGLTWLYFHNRNRSLEVMLKKSLSAKTLSVVYQPIVDLTDGKLLAFEALARWEITKGEFIPPDIFIPRAETAGLADKITIFVLERVLEEMGDLLRNDRTMRININLTSNNLQNHDFPTILAQSLAAADIKPHQIGLELTERNAVDFAKAASCVQKLREQGHLIYIDDFGTGYSSLAYLGQLHVDAIKIDKAFTRMIGIECDTISIVPHIVTMAQNYGLDVVVEGIETNAQWESLRRLNNRLTGQGWLFGKPMTATAAQRQIAQREASSDVSNQGKTQ